MRYSIKQFFRQVFCRHSWYKQTDRYTGVSNTGKTIEVNITVCVCRKCESCRVSTYHKH